MLIDDECMSECQAYDGVFWKCPSLELEGFFVVYFGKFYLDEWFLFYFSFFQWTMTRKEYTSIHLLEDMVLFGGRCPSIWQYPLAKSI